MRKLRMGMIGGGKDAFIGAIHRIAANTDGLIELVCGALSIDKNIAVDSGRSLFLPEDRIYTTFEEMLKKKVHYLQTKEWISLLSLPPILLILLQQWRVWKMVFMW
ncbi:MAG: hypothetical protein WKF59_22925 [Chitinophagaceae bacterium]